VGVRERFENEPGISEEFWVGRVLLLRGLFEAIRDWGVWKE
jgi:hypothetical protein